MRSPFLLLVAASIGAAAPTTYVVSARGGTHSSLQAAVDACPSSGCRVELTDSVYSFSEPVWIRGKSDISIVGVRGDGKRPVFSLDASAREPAPIPDVGTHSAIRTAPVTWSKASSPDTIRDPDGTLDILEYAADLGTVGTAAKFLLHPGRTAEGANDPGRPAGWLLTPFTSAQAGDTSYGFSNTAPFLQLGLLAIDSSRHVRVSGIEFDGGTPLGFETKALWNDRYGQLGGLAAISMNRSFQNKIVDCEFHGWHVGVRSVDANQGGLASDLMSVDQKGQASYWGIRPLANPGAMGGHRIEGNLAHHNELFVALEQSWDLATSIRFNRVWENGKSRLLTKAADSALKAKSDEWTTCRGGFLLLKDVVYPSTIIQGNTLVRNTLDVGHVGWRASTSQLFFDNVTVRRDGQGDWKELTNWLGGNARNNWIASTRNASMTWREPDSIIPFCNPSRCAPLTPAWGSAAIDDKLVGKGLLGDDLGALWQTPRREESIRVQDQTLGYVERVESGWSVTLPLPVQAAPSIRDLRIALAQTQKVAVFTDAIATNKNVPTPLSALRDAPVSAGVNIVTFLVPASARDSIWLVEIAVAGVDDQTGSVAHSNLGTWLVRPLGKQLQVVRTDTGSVEPGQIVTFSVSVKDSTGRPASLSAPPALNAPGWSIAAKAAEPAIAARAAEAADHFEIQATAPSKEGVSQVVFWSAENGRPQAIAGAAYVQVGSVPTSTPSRPARSAAWRIAAVSRGAGGWDVAIRGAAPGALADARLLDVGGRSWTPTIRTSDKDGSSLRFTAVNGGAYFLRVDGHAKPIVLMP